MEEYGSYNWNQQGNEPQNNAPMEPKKPHGKNNKNAAKWAKKIGAGSTERGTLRRRSRGCIYRSYLCNRCDSKSKGNTDRK